MSKTRIFALVGIVVLVAAFLTNPSEEKYEEVLRAKAKELLTSQLDYEHEDAMQLGMMLFGDRVIDEFLANNVYIKNYYLFSLVEIRWQAEAQVVGGGALGQVWLSSKIDSEADKIILILKDL
ncbi:DUF4359 domain-containing protein [Sphingobacterium sp. lm-10]|uniref:DUF4359 domain-containing protein n=1 Tax=Sphingobacterium sp. lm-10 TaxID=2944904 RepID=UPI002021CC6C|nr:DUF4359 domain-containing protein [Sphingobacterium sp. lm-10]MCL7988260.1 DUF4359 domain-containing protein [Sphingobacterium sp. lm-10]